MSGRGLFRRAGALVLLAWALGFVVFATALPMPAEPARSDAVIVLTGGPGRIPRGLELLREGHSRRLLVSGVDKEVRKEEFAALHDVGAELMACCVTLGYESVDTRSNAREAARWIADNNLRTVRLVTTDWHMRRAAYELGAAAPSVAIVRDAVRSRPSFRILFLEYHKLLARYLAELASW